MNILITIGMILVAIWAASLIMHFLGWIVHFVLIIALAMIIYGFIRKRTAI